MFVAVWIAASLSLYYLFLCFVRWWLVARHYEPGFRLMHWRDVAFAWSCLDMSSHPTLFRLLIVVIPILLVVVGICIQAW